MPDKFENGVFFLKTPQMFSVRTTPEEFENEGFSQKTHQIFSVHTISEILKNATPPDNTEGRRNALFSVVV